MNRHSRIAAASQQDVPQASCGHPAFAPNEPLAEAERFATLSLPAWADNLPGRILLSTILAECPSIRPERNSADYAFNGFRYMGIAAARLRRLFDHGLEQLTDAETAAYRAGEPHRHLTDAVQAYLMQERPEDLIARLLGGRV